ncbi:MAG: hypothetical protein ACK559_41440, partial [bacterium]
MTDRSAARSADTSCSVIYGSVNFVSFDWILSYLSWFLRFYLDICIVVIFDFIFVVFFCIFW